MATWRALLSPSRDISIQESCQQEHSTQVKRPKVVTQSTNQSQQKPTIKREYSKSIDKAFIQSSSTDMLEQIQVVNEQNELKELLLFNCLNMKKLQEIIDEHDYNQRQIVALEKQILHQREKYALKIRGKVQQCKKQIKIIQKAILTQQVQ